MPTDSRKPARSDNFERSHRAQVGSSSTSSKFTTREIKTKLPHTPDPKPAPAVKALTKSRLKKSHPITKEPSKSQPNAISLQAALTHSSTTARPRTPIGIKMPASTRNRNHLQIPEPITKGTSPRIRNSSTAPNRYDQMSHNGRQDPYYIPSDSEDERPRGRKPTSTAGGRKEATSLNKKRANIVVPRTKHRTVLSSSPKEVVAKPSTPRASSQKAHVPGHRSQSHAPAPIPLSTQIISVDSSSSESLSRPTSHRQPNIKPSVPAQITSSPTMITVDDSSSNGVKSPLATSLRPRSTTAGGSSSFPRTLFKTLKSATTTSPTRLSPQSRRSPDSVSTPINPTAKTIGKRAARSINNHLKFIDGKPKYTTQAVEKPDLAKKDSRASVGSHTRSPIQNKPRVSKDRDTRAVVLDISSSQRPAIDDVKKSVKEVIDKPIPESFFEERDHSDDEYKPPFDNEEPSSEDGDNGSPSFEGTKIIAPPAPTRDIESSQPSLGRRLRSGSHPKAPDSFGPINKLPPSSRGSGSTPKLPVRTSKFGRGYSKRVHDAFSDASNSYRSDNETSELVDLNTTLQPSEDGKNDDKGLVISKQTDSAKKPQWTPLSWMERYETEFMPGRDGSVWLATGPFKGWILDGPGTGSYLVGYDEPQDETIVEAEKTAELRWNLRWADFEGDYTSNVEEPSDEEVGPGRTTSDIHEDTALTNIRVLIDSKEASCNESFPSISSNVPENPKARDVCNGDKSVERAECMERTRRYVLTGGSSNEVELQQKDDLARPTSGKTRGKLPAYLAPITIPQDIPSPPSAESETTSTLITQQLINDCAPPSNQELAELMSSSPAIRTLSTPSLMHKIDEPADSSSSESSSGIPAHISPKPVSQSLEVPRTRSASFGLEHISAAHILDGIAGRRTTRSLTNLLPQTAKSNKRALDIKRVSADVKTELPVQRKKNSRKTNIVVEVPGLSIEERKEYDVISSSPDICSTLSPKSFKEINEATSRVDTDSDDPDAEQALDYVLRQSPKWLAGVTEANDVDGMKTNVAKPSPNSMVPLSAQKSCKGIMKRRVPDPEDMVPEESHPAVAETAAPIPMYNSPTTFEKGHSSSPGGSSKAKKHQKRKAIALDSPSASHSPLGKKQKVDDGRSQIKTERLTYRQRRRSRRRRLGEQKKDRAQSRVRNDVSSKGVYGSSRSAMTPPTSSRPTSSETS